MATRASVHPEIDRTALAKQLGKDRGYITKLLNGTRAAPLPVALEIFRITGICLGQLAGRTPSEIDALRLAHSVIADTRVAAE